MKEEKNEERRGRKRDLEKKEYKRLSMRRKSGRVQNKQFFIKKKQKKKK